MNLRKLQAFLWRFFPLVVLLAGAAVAIPLARCQSLSLSRVGSGPIPAGSSATLNVVLSGSGGGVVALQWNIAADVPGTVISGASLTPATIMQGASIACSPPGAVCLIYNLRGSVPLPDTAVASLTVTPPAGAASVTVTLSNPIGATGGGQMFSFLGPAVTIPVLPVAPNLPAFTNATDLGQFPPSGTVNTPAFDPLGGSFLALKIFCGGCQSGQSSVDAVSFKPDDLNLPPVPLARAALVSANGVVDVWALTGPRPQISGSFILTTAGIAILQVQAYAANNVLTWVPSTNVVNLGNAMATTTVTALNPGDLLAVFANGVRPYSSDTGTVRLTGVVDQVAVAGLNTVHTEVDFQGPNYANAIVVLDLQGSPVVYGVR